MSMSRGPISHAAKADAAHQALVAEQWRDWHAYLEAQLRLLDAQQAEATALPSFERQATSWEVQREQAQATLRRIPAARRAVFDAERDGRRDDVQRDLEQAQRARTGDGRPPSIDADIIERELLRTLLHEAEGRDAPSERGLVPMGDGRWYEVHVPSLMTVPEAADYGVGEFDDPGRRTRLMLIGGLLLLLVAGMWLTWPRAETRLLAAGSTVPAVNGAAVQPWEVRAVVVGSGGKTTTLPTTATTEQHWPATRTDARPVAYWRSTALLPLELCLPPDQLAAATTLRLRAAPALPERVYALTIAAPAHPDLVIQTCGAAARPESRWGRLTTVATPPVEEFDQPVRLAEDRVLRLRDIRVVGPGQDATLPADQVRVLLQVDAPADLDWSAMAPTLTLATGNALLPSETEPRTAGAELRYLVPAFDTPLEAAWTITRDGASHNHRWRLTLDPPPSRLAMLRAMLSVAEIAARRTDDGSAMSLALTLRNTGAARLELTPDDLLLSQGNAPVAVPALPALRTPLLPGEQRTVEALLPSLRVDQPLVVSIGAVRYAVRFP